MRAAAGRRLLALAAVTAALLALSAGPAPAAKDDVDRKIKDGRITESSGLATSRLHPGILWTHNDSGNRPRIYAIDQDGSTAAALTLLQEPNVDWEAIAAVHTPAAGDWIAVGDIGDNNGVHDNVRIALVREPQQLRDMSVTPPQVLRLTYPDGPRDAEALLADPRNGRLYIVSKNLFGSDLYAVPEQLWPGRATGSGRVSRVTEMTKVASMSAGLITDGVFLPDGRMLLRGYGKAFVLDRPESVKNGRISTLADARLPDQEQGESITVTADGKEALIGSEGKRQPVLRVPVPGVEDPGSTDDSDGSGDSDGSDPTVTLPPDPNSDSDSDSDSDSAEATARADSAAGTAVPGQGPAFGGVGNLRVWILVIGGALVASVLTFGALVLRQGRR